MATVHLEKRGRESFPDGVRKRLPTPFFLSELLTYGVALVLTLVIVVLLLELWQADLTVPFAYRQDSLPVLTWTKTLLDNGWWLANKYLGAPARLEMYDYPTNCNLHFLALKCLSLFTSNPAVLVNLYFILSFPLISLAALAALRSTGRCAHRGDRGRRSLCVLALSFLAGRIASVLGRLLHGPAPPHGRCLARQR